MAKAQRFLVLYSGLLTVVFVVTVLSASAPPRTTAFDEISVGRINVVEPDGTLRMVISNHARLAGIIVRGKERPFGRPQAGLIFYNDEASEIGGLIFGGRRNEKGEVVDSGASLSFDRYEANQIVQLIGVDDKEDKIVGLIVSDSPSGSEVHRRIWLGRGDDGAAALALLDGKGKKRLLMQVAADGETRFSVLDANGNAVKELLPAAQ
ncbi:MAG: hypothetical protein ACRD2T_16445 [Thermoanaerobaculia bacterium]